MVVTVDLYKELGIDRTWNENQIREQLKKLQKLWTQRQGACNEKEQLILIADILHKIEDGFRYLIKDVKRLKYDKGLEQAYKEGRIVDKEEKKLQSVLEQAKEYYRKGNIQLAIEYLQEAIDGNINDPFAYELMASCNVHNSRPDLAVQVLDKGAAIFKDNYKLRWMATRILIDSTSDFEEAQRRVNELIEMEPDNSTGHSEQMYLHLKKGEEELAYLETDAYIAAHPNDIEYKKNVAYNLDWFSQSCYYYDSVSNSSFIADKSSYEKCLKIREKAVEIFDDEYTRNQLERAQYFGQKEWNNWNIESIVTLLVCGIPLTLLGGVGLPLLVMAGILIHYSYRPYWQIYETYVTGEMGKTEKLVSAIGDIAAKIAVKLVYLVWNIIKWVFEFCWWAVFRK